MMLYADIHSWLFNETCSKFRRGTRLVALLVRQSAVGQVSNTKALTIKRIMMRARVQKWSKKSVIIENKIRSDAKQKQSGRDKNLPRKHFEVKHTGEARQNPRERTTCKRTLKWSCNFDHIVGVWMMLQVPVAAYLVGLSWCLKPLTRGSRQHGKQWNTAYCANWDKDGVLYKPFLYTRIFGAFVFSAKQTLQLYRSAHYAHNYILLPHALLRKTISELFLATAILKLCPFTFLTNPKVSADTRARLRAFLCFRRLAFATFQAETYCNPWN